MNPSVFRPALVLLALLTLLTGILYPLAITGIAQVAFAGSAGGSLIERNGVPVASRLIGQSFTDAKYFWSRPSATAPMPYNAAASGGSNQGPLNPALVDAVKGRIAALREAHPDQTGPVPVDLVTTSASGLDPHESVAAALYQVERVAKARKLPQERVRALVARHSEGRILRIFGEPRVNVVELNLALDAMPAGAP
ncbi:MAG: potassium-transporting ATPase subunit KdpC [Gammaproteobacteria bacterium]